MTQKLLNIKKFIHKYCPFFIYPVKTKNFSDIKFIRIRNFFIINLIVYIRESLEDIL